MQSVLPRTNPLPMPYYSRTSLNNTVNGNGNGHTAVQPATPVATTLGRKRKRLDISYSEIIEDGREVIVIEDTPPPATASPATTARTGAFSQSYQPPLYSAPIRTRARAAAEAQQHQQALSASTSSHITAPAPKKRKRDHVEETRTLPSKKPATSSHYAPPTVPTASWDSRSAAATSDVRARPPLCIRNLLTLFLSQTSGGAVSCDDKEGHYIIVPNDIINKRCTYCCQ